LHSWIYHDRDKVVALFYINFEDLLSVIEAADIGLYALNLGLEHRLPEVLKTLLILG
jgi:hypothetical protein